MSFLTRICRQLLKQKLRKHTLCRWLHKESSILEGTVDRYQGVTVDLLKQIPASTSLQHFKDILKASLRQWRNEDRQAVWLQIPIHYSRYIDVAAEQGFEFHHAEKDCCLLKLWLHHRPDATPRFATHQVGVCGVVLREDTKELLVVQERNSQFTMWKFPGGLSNLGEDIGDAAVRETLEETGVKSNFASIVAFRQQHQHPSAFGRSDLYVVCRLLPVSFDIVPCDKEISKCRWMPIDELKDNIQITSITHRIVSLISYGIEHGFDNIDLTGEEMKSVYNGQIFNLFHRPLKKARV